MKYIQFHKSVSERLIQEVLQRRGWVLNKPYTVDLTNEDAFLVSSRYSIFSVADGVPLAVHPGSEYPLPSGVQEVAKIFCEESIKNAEQLYDEMSSDKMRDIFIRANKEVRKYNSEKDRIAETINYWDHDYYCATAALAVLKERKLFWGNICDSGVAVFDEKGKKKFMTDDGWSFFNKNRPSDWEKLPLFERTIIKNRDFRNKVINNQRSGYGVANGEESALAYLDFGSKDLEKGDIVFVYTDGFFPYLGKRDFINLFLEWPDDLRAHTEKQTSFEYSDYARMYEWNSEGSLIAVKIE